MTLQKVPVVGGGIGAMSAAIAFRQRCVAVDPIAASGIRSNAIAPTFIETTVTRPFLEDGTFKARVLAKIKLGGSDRSRI